MAAGARPYGGRLTALPAQEGAFEHTPSACDCVVATDGRRLAAHRARSEDPPEPKSWCFCSLHREPLLLLVSFSP